VLRWESAVGVEVVVFVWTAWLAPHIGCTQPQDADFDGHPYAGEESIFGLFDGCTFTPGVFQTARARPIPQQCPAEP